MKDLFAKLKLLVANACLIESFYLAVLDFGKSGIKNGFLHAKILALRLQYWAGENPQELAKVEAAIAKIMAGVEELVGVVKANESILKTIFSEVGEAFGKTLKPAREEVEFLGAKIDFSMAEGDEPNELYVSIDDDFGDMTPEEVAAFRSKAAAKAAEEEARIQKWNTECKYAEAHPTPAQVFNKAKWNAEDAFDKAKHEIKGTVFERNAQIREAWEIRRLAKERALAEYVASRSKVHGR